MNVKFNYQIALNVNAKCNMRFFRFEMTRNTGHEYCHAVSLAALLKSEIFF